MVAGGGAEGYVLVGDEADADIVRTEFFLEDDASALNITSRDVKAVGADAEGNLVLGGLPGFEIVLDDGGADTPPVTTREFEDDMASFEAAAQTSKLEFGTVNQCAGFAKPTYLARTIEPLKFGDAESGLSSEYRDVHIYSILNMHEIICTNLAEYCNICTHSVAACADA